MKIVLVGLLSIGFMMASEDTPIVVDSDGKTHVKRRVYISGNTGSNGARGFAQVYMDRQARKDDMIRRLQAKLDKLQAAKLAVAKAE